MKFWAQGYTWKWNQIYALFSTFKNKQTKWRLSDGSEILRRHIHNFPRWFFKCELIFFTELEIRFVKLVLTHANSVQLRNENYLLGAIGHKPAYIWRKWNFKTTYGPFSKIIFVIWMDFVHRAWSEFSKTGPNLCQLSLVIWWLWFVSVKLNPSLNIFFISRQISTFWRPILDKSVILTNNQREILSSVLYIKIKSNICFVQYIFEL